ncbi:MAG: hypothetical protein ABIQ32_13645 [Sphingomicrobium sp.]
MRVSSRLIRVGTEYIAMVLVLLGFARVVVNFFKFGYLQAPFVFDIGDTFMDWFNTAYWAHNPGAYSVWRTIYLPLSFVITGALGNPRCYGNAPYDARDCDVFGIVVIVLMYVACCIVAAVAMYRRDRSTAVARSIALCLGGPILFALERGNLILPALFAFMLAYGGLVRSRGFIAASAVMANLKIYLLLPLVSLMIERRWRLFELSLIAIVALYLLTLFFVGAGTPTEFVANLQNWFNFRSGVVWDEILYTTTYKPFLQLDVGQYPVRDFIEQPVVDIAKRFIEVEVIVSRTLALACLVLAWVYPTAVSRSRVVFFVLMQSFIIQNPGGYAITFVVFLVFMERWRNVPTALAIVCAFLISVPGDMTVTTIFEVERESWLSGRIVQSPYILPLGSFIRPGMILLILWALAFDTLRDIHRAAKAGPPSWGFRRCVKARGEPEAGTPQAPAAG